ncbi:MAG: tetratricopeptide repeat protein [Armatimonadota bacterium]
MNYRAIIMITVLIALLGHARVVFAANDSMKELTEGKITVSYPAEYEKQAKKVMAIAKSSIQTPLDIHSRIITILADPDATAKDISTLLGCDDKQDEAARRLKAYKTKSQVLVACFSNIHLVSKTDAAAKGGVDAGLVQVRYSKDNDEFNMTIDTAAADPSLIKNTYLPIFVNPDGSVRAQDKLAGIALDYLGSSKSMLMAPIHETVGYVMAEELNLYYPFSRWFNEGVSGWVARHVITKADPKLVSIANELLSVSSKSKELRSKVNLYSWTQPAFQNLRSANQDPSLEIAHTQYAIEAISTLLNKNGAQVLPKIMREVNFNADADTDTICNAIKKVTGTDFRSVLLTYVPVDVRNGIDTNTPKKLCTRAEELVQEKSWSDAADRLRTALQMSPQDVNARLNLAWVERETGQKLDSEIQVFLAARLLTNGKHSFHLYGDSLEGNYVLARLSMLLGDVNSAKKLLSPILQAKPNDPDAKRTMAEIAVLEGGNQTEQGSSSGAGNQ